MAKKTFWKKLDLVFGLFFLLIMSIVHGFMFMFNDKPYTPRSLYITITAIGTFCTILVLGAIAFGVYRFLKKNHSEVALKRALQVYGFFLIALLIVAWFEFGDNLKKRDKQEYLEAFRPVYLEIMKQKLERDYVSDTMVTNHLDDIAGCTYIYLEMDEELFLHFKAAKDKREFILWNKSLEEDIKSCIEFQKEDHSFNDL